MWGLSSPLGIKPVPPVVEAQNLINQLDRQGNPIELFLITSFNIYWCDIIPKKVFGKKFIKCNWVGGSSVKTIPSRYGAL